MSNGFDHLKLCKADAEMLDRLVDVGFELDQLEYLTPEDKQRATSILKMFGFLDAYPVEDASDSLIDATLVRIDQYESQRTARMQIHTPELETTKRGFRIRMPDLITVAAMILVTVSVFTMISNSTRNQSLTNQCASNMAMVGRGLVNYALDHNGETPTESAPAVASLFGGLAPERTNAQLLAKKGYCDHNHLNCPGHSGESSGFSYQTQPAAMWDAIRNQGKLFIIMSDQNPILKQLLANQKYDQLTPSPAHGSLGQNHLRDDGSINSVAAPIFKGDLIWVLDAQNKGIDIFLTH
ncbi:MAG TPA: hypothetical protein EYO01_06965 [Phycisphaerales bacterium]|nr:hypothetical protein [Phycisphaerales bacterium]HIB01718.1 hypothetical protein [Phycisphaerales bacterium]HIB50661.1 hypothetical protein [Phycisphaerales bacterium]HIN83954.1 hypothetical protein [Phycisphaerales bacterium]